MTEIPQEIVADGFVVPQIFQLPLQPRATVHRSRGMAAITRCLHFAECKAIAFISDPESDQIGTQQAGPALSLVASVRPWEAA